MHVLILSAIRSGSTYLLHLLRDTGFFYYAEPHDPHPSLVQQMAIHEFLAPNAAIEPWAVEGRDKTRDDCLDYLEVKCAFILRQPCLFKILMEQYSHYMLTPEDRPIVESFIPDPRYIWLERGDVVARTVSAYLFFKSRTDHIYDQKSYDDYMGRAVDIDAEGLMDVYRNHVQECDWSRYLYGADYLKIEYEDLIAHPRDTLEKCLKHLGMGYEGLDMQAIVDRQPKFKTERPESEMWKQTLRRMINRRRVM